MLIENLHIEGGRLAGREGVHLSAEGVNLPGDVDGRSSGRPFEEHMFNEMRKPGLRGFFVTGTDINPNADRDRLECRDPLADQTDPVVEDEFTIQGYYPAVGSFAASPAGTGIVSFRLRRIFPCLS